MTDVCTKEVFSVRLKHLLQEKGLNGYQLSIKLGVDKGRVYHWLHGDNLPDLFSFCSICSALNITPNEFLCIDITDNVKPLK